MIEQLKKRLSEEQVGQISKVIAEQYTKWLRKTSDPEYQELYAAEYAPHRKKHEISWAICSGFKSGSVIAGMRAEALKYGGGHIVPRLCSKEVELYILSKRSDFQAKYLMEQYRLNKNNFGGRKLFAYIKFSAEKEKLESVSLCLPDEQGNVIAEEVLLDQTMIQKLAA